MMEAFDIDDILAASGDRQRDLIPILHRILARFGYIPPETVGRIARRVHVSANEVYGVLTFYKAFPVEPRGRHQLTVCLGTACHVRGGVRIAEDFERRLGIRAGETSPDREFTLETVNCLGCCAIGPVVVADGRYHSHVTPQDVAAILAKTGGRAS